MATFAGAALHASPDSAIAYGNQPFAFCSEFFQFLLIVRLADAAFHKSDVDPAIFITALSEWKTGDVHERQELF
jgi:hypothetical protein